MNSSLPIASSGRSTCVTASSFRPVESRRVSPPCTTWRHPLHRDVIDIYRKDAKYSAPEFGMFSTARDMERFFRMAMNGGTLDGHRILTPDTVRTMLQPRVPTSIAGISQGLAWFICTDASRQTALRISPGSFGAAGASGTFGWIDPDQKLIRLLLMQRFGGADVERNAFMSLAADVT